MSLRDRVNSEVLCRRGALWGLCALLAFVLSVPAQDSTASPGDPPEGLYETLAGDLPGVLMARSKPYLVVGDVFVPQGREVSIQAGTVLLFRNFTGLHVLGRLLAKGTQERPVVFTSENDTDYNQHESPGPAPYDWNGIRLHEDAVGSELDYCAILYSVDGIMSETRFIRLDPCLFLHNGNANLTIEGEVKEVSDTYYRHVISRAETYAPGGPLAVLRDPLARRRNVTRYSGLALTVGGTVLGIVFSGRYGTAQDDFRVISGTDRDNLAGGSSAQWEEARGRVNGNLAGMLVGWGLMAVGAAGIAWTFTF